MSKVKPQVGQVWKCNENSEEVGLLRPRENGVAYFSAYGGKLLTPLDVFLSDFEFVPQDDLEWLAVNAEVWRGEESADGLASDCVHKNCEFSYFYSLNQGHGYTRQQWQNMRYKLGLDEKPRVSAEEWAEMLRDKRGSKLESLKCDLERRLQRYVGGDWTEMLSDKH